MCPCWCLEDTCIQCDPSVSKSGASPRSHPSHRLSAYTRSLHVRKATFHLRIQLSDCHLQKMQHLCHTVIGFSGVLVWLKSWMRTYAFIWDGFMTASLTTASFVIPKIKIKTWLWLHRQIRDVHRDSATDIFVEESKLSCMSAISLGYTDMTILTA